MTKISKSNPIQPVSALVIPFQYEDHPVHIHRDASGNPWFFAKDVCDILGIRNARDAIKRMLDPDEINTVGITDGIRGNPIRKTVSESGLYALILRSNKPEARKFRKWVTSEVLPSIRKTGAYRTPEPPAERVEEPRLRSDPPRLEPAVPFHFEHRAVRVQQTRDGGIWFLVRDVFRILGIPNSRDALLKVLQQGDVKKLYLMDRLGRLQPTNLISEWGLFALIRRSDRSEAKRFGTWIASEVLPALRRDNAGFMAERRIQGAEARSGDRVRWYGEWVHPYLPDEAQAEAAISFLRESGEGSIDVKNQGACVIHLKRLHELGRTLWSGLLPHRGPAWDQWDLGDWGNLLYIRSVFDLVRSSPYFRLSREERDVLCETEAALIAEARDTLDEDVRTYGESVACVARIICVGVAAIDHDLLWN